MLDMGIAMSNIMVTGTLPVAWFYISISILSLQS